VKKCKNQQNKNEPKKANAFILIAGVIGNIMGWRVVKM